jgi:hypothetical protein
MQDRLLADALDGYDKVKGDHIGRIEELQKHILQRTHSKNNDFRNWGIVAGFIVMIVFVSYFFLKDAYYLSDNYIIVQNKEPEIRIQNPITQDTLSMLNKNPEEKASSSLTEPARLSKILSETDSNEELEEKNFTTDSSLPVDTNPDLSITIDENKYELNENEANTDSQEIQLSTTPEPVTGNNDYEKYLKTKLIPPVDSDCKNAKGKVVLSFYVDGNGRPFGINVKKSLCPAADEEAIRLVKEGPGWTTGENEVEIDVKF